VKEKSKANYTSKHAIRNLDMTLIQENFKLIICIH